MKSFRYVVCSSLPIFLLSFLPKIAFAQSEPTPQIDTAKETALHKLVRKATHKSNFFSDVTVDLQIEGGIMGNSGFGGSHGQNFGQLLANHSDQASLNQVLLDINKPVEDLGHGYGLGASIEMLYGSDASVYLIDGVSDRWFNSRYQLAPTSAHLTLHTPWITKYGIDTEAGIFMSPMGVEGLSASQRPFYTMAYTTQFSTSFEHIGVMSHVNLNKHFKLLFEIDAGNQVSFGRGNNNGVPDGMFGVSGDDLWHHRLSFNYVLRMGPEGSWRNFGRAEAKAGDRFWNDLSATLQVNKKLSVTGQLNQVHDEALQADAWGGVILSAYKLSKTLTFNARGEVYRDGKGAYVSQYIGNQAYSRSYLGTNNAANYTTSAPGATTYGDLSFNVAWRPEVKYVKLLQFRPEIRFDRALNNGSKPFDNFKHRDRILFGGDITLGL